MAESLKKTTFKNVSYNAIGKAVAFLFQSIANIILSRELIAEDYGVVGFAMIFVTFMRNFSGFGINKAAVHAKDFDEKKMSTVFTLRLILSLLAFTTLFLSSGFAEHFIDHPSIVAVIRILALNILIDNISSVSSICLERNLKFSIISIAETGLVVSSSITAIVLAVNGFKYWSIVYGSISSNLVFSLILYFCMPYRFRFAIDLDVAKEYLRYGLYVFCTGLLIFATYNMDNFIIGSVAGVSQLGYYAIAFSWGSLVCSVMFGVVFSVLFPTFTKMRDDPIRMKQAYLKIMQYTALISLLWNVGLFCVADNFLYTVLGKNTDKWFPALQTLRILCFYGVIRALNSPASAFVMALGNPRTQFKANILTALIEIPLVYPAIKYGSIEVVGLVVLLSYAFQFAVYLPALKQTNNISAREICTTIWPAVASGVAMLLCYFVLNGLFPHSITKLVGSIFLLTFVYIILYGILTRWRTYIQLKDLIFSGS
jgi:O-antigen/teichoic acid export membrane protein